MKLSIITVCFNSQDTIEDTIQSVLSQTYHDIEYIIIDGNSTDRTLEKIEAYKDKISKVISEPDNGIYDAMNKGIRLATGDVIAVLNSDDVYLNQTVAVNMINLITKDDLDAAYADLVYVDKGETNNIIRVWKAGNYKRGSFCYGWVPPHPTFFCRKNVFEKYGYFNSDFKIAADFELLLRFIEKNQIKVGYFPDVIVKMRTQGKSNVLRGILRGNQEILKSFGLNDLKYSPLFFFYKPVIKIFQFFKKSWQELT